MIVHGPECYHDCYQEVSHGLRRRQRFKNDRGGWTMFATIDGKRYKRTGADEDRGKAKMSELRKQLAVEATDIELDHHRRHRARRVVRA